MTYNSYLDSIALTGSDLAYFKQVLTSMATNSTQEKRNAACVEGITSPEGSFECKRYLTFCMLELPEARKWGFENLTGRDLHYFMMEVMFNNAKDVSSSELKILAMNPAFVASCGDDKFDFIKLTFSGMTVTVPTNKIKTMLVIELTEAGSMTLEVAEYIITTNKAARFGHDALRHLVDEKPIIEWARKKYSLEEAPETWVRRMISAP